MPPAAYGRHGETSALGRLRKTAGFIQESLAEALEVDRSTVVRWEAGDHERFPYIRPKLARLAQRYYIQALNPAMNGGNRLFAANIFSDMSRLTIPNATGMRGARHALALARAGTTIAGKPTPTLAAQLSAVEARGHTLCRDTSATRSAVLEAERHYERFRPDGEPAWLNFYTEAELTADLGRALRDSGEPAAAIGLMTRTLHGYEPWRVRSRCFVQTDLPAAYLIGGDYEHAAALTRDAMNTAGQVSSSRTVSRIRTLQQQIRPLHSVGLAKMDEEITDFLRRAHDNENIP